MRYHEPFHDVQFLDDEASATMAPHFADSFWIKTLAPNPQYL